MVKLMVGTVSGLLLFAAGLPAQSAGDSPSGKVGLKETADPRKTVKAAQPRGTAKGQAIRLWDAKTGKPTQTGAERTKENPNQEIVELLKKAIQKLEGQNPPKSGGRFAIRFEGVELKMGGGESPILEKAQAEVKAATQRLEEARAQLAKIQAANQARDSQAAEQQLRLAQDRLQQMLKSQQARDRVLQPKRVEATPQDRIGELEKRLDRLSRVVEELARELKGKPR